MTTSEKDTLINHLAGDPFEKKNLTSAPHQQQQPPGFMLAGWLFTSA